ncbi:MULTISPECIES: hypothetical protein [Nitrosomonas]|uniref:hypothetical protein n=1 Tax=Nitrosomonas TaxID=914 RepID=UPI0019378821|nr:MULTISPECIES: hypothetical protein [Nitrosomonas]QOJ08440.1 MAG: hypothetical protein HRU73_02435 [Nitrosomonas sp. H1_AOB3]
MTKLATEMTVHTCPLTKDALTSATATFGRKMGRTWGKPQKLPSYSGLSTDTSTLR